MSTAAERALRSGRRGSPWRRGWTVGETGGAVDLDTVKVQIRRGPTETHELVASSFDHVTLGVAEVDLTGTTNTAPKALRLAVTADDSATIEEGDLWLHATATVTPDGEDPVPGETIGFYLVKWLPRVVVP